MKTLIRAAIGCGLLAAAATVSATPDWAAFGINPDISYSGIRHVETDEGAMEMEEYRAPAKYRIDVRHEGQAGRMLLRDDHSTAYLLIPSMGAYMELPMEEALASTELHPPMLERTEVGTETVLGYRTTKYRTVFEDDGEGQASGFMWVTEHGIPIKWDIVYEGDDGLSERVVSELRDLQVGPQDPALFEIPDGYQSLNLGDVAAMMRGALQESRAAGAPPADATGRQAPAQSSIAEDVAEEAAAAAREEARRSAVEEARRGTREGIRSIFGR